MTKKELTSFSSSVTLDNYNSTTQLANHEVKPPGFGNGSTNSLSKTKDQPYNPFENRNLEHPTSTTGSLIHLLKSSLGTGILAMPNAFRNGGLAFGFVGTIVIGFICTYCVHILVKTSHEICSRIQVGSLGFSETCGAAFEYGPKPVRKFSSAAKLFVEIALVFTYFMGVCVYIVFIAESIEQLIDHWLPNNDLSIYVYMIIICFCLTLTIQVKELKHLVVFSFFANIFMVTSFAITLYYMFIDIPPISDRKLIFTDITKLPMFFSTVIFAMEGIGCIMPVENNMGKPQHFLGCPGVLNVAMSIVVVLYSSIGFFGYLKYGEDTKASVTLNLPVDEVPAQVVKLLIALAVFFTTNLQLYAPLDILWKKLFEPRCSKSTRKTTLEALMRCTFVVLSTVVAMAVPDLEPIIGLVGSVCFSTLGLLIPSVVETVWRWDGRLGLLKWRLVKNVVLGVLAMCALISGATQSIQTLIENVHSK